MDQINRKYTNIPWIQPQLSVLPVQIYKSISNTTPIKVVIFNHYHDMKTHQRWHDTLIKKINIAKLKILMFSWCDWTLMQNWFWWLIKDKSKFSEWRHVALPTSIESNLSKFVTRIWCFKGATKISVINIKIGRAIWKIHLF